MIQDIQDMEQTIDQYQLTLDVIGQKGGTKPRWKEEETQYIETFRQIVRLRREIRRTKVLGLMMESIL